MDVQPLYFEILANKLVGLLLLGIRPTAHSFLVALRDIEKITKSRYIGFFQISNMRLPEIVCDLRELSIANMTGELELEKIMYR